LAQQETNIGQSPNAFGILLVVCTALFFGVLNASAVGVILPEIAEDLSIGPGQLSWLMTGFLLIYAIAIPLYGRLADFYGARMLFLLGVAIFAAGSVLSALADNYTLLLASRIVQAVGGAAVPGLGITLASRAYGPEARARYWALPPQPSVWVEQLALCWAESCPSHSAGSLSLSSTPLRPSPFP
jgi:MFS family permease